MRAHQPPWRGIVRLVRGGQLSRRFRRAWSVPRALLVIACGIVLVMYCVNDDMNGDPVTPRGDGVYRPVLARGDGHMLYLMARSTALDGDWVFDNDLARFGDPWREPRTATGRKAIIHPIGVPLIWTPLIWVAEAGAAVANVFGADVPMHGYTLWHQRFVFLSSVLAACGAVLLGRRLAMKAVGGPWSATYSAIAILLGTSLTYYATYMPSYSHAIDAFVCAAFLGYWAGTVGRSDVRRWVVLGLLLGAATLVRTQELAMGVVVALEVAIEVVRGMRAPERWQIARRWVGGGGLALAVTLVVMIPQLLEWHLVFGTITELPQGRRYTRFEAPMVMELLFSRRNGWFSTTPIAYAAVIGLFCLPRRSRVIAAGLIATVVLQVYLNSTILDWWGSAAFGQRRLCNVTLPLVVGLAALMWRIGRFASRRRVPRFVLHAVPFIVLGPCVVTNLNHVGKLKAGKAANSELDPACCTYVPRPLRAPAELVADRLANPFSFPANAIFALRHDVPITRWDRIVGNYPITPGLGDVRGDRLWALRGVWRAGSPNLRGYLIGPWSAPFNIGRPFRLTLGRSATMLVPNLLPYGQRVSVWLAPAGTDHVRVRWNGDVVAEVDLAPGWQRVGFDLPAIELHTNELTVESDLGPLRFPDLPNLIVPVGVAVSDIELQVIRPGGETSAR